MPINPGKVRNYCTIAGAVVGGIIGAVATIGTGGAAAPVAAGAAQAGAVAGTAIGTTISVITGSASIGAFLSRFGVSDAIEMLRAKRVAILGNGRVGKDTLYDRIVNTDQIIHSATSNGTKFRRGIFGFTRANSTGVSKEYAGAYLRDIFKVAGENWQSWKEIIVDNNPHGLIFIVDSPVKAWRRQHGKSDIGSDIAGNPDPDQRFQKELDSLNFVVRTFSDVPKRRLKTVMLL